MKIVWKKILVLILCVLSYGYFPLAAADVPDGWAHRLCACLDALRQESRVEDSTQLALCVYDLTADSMLYAHHPSWRMRPASTMKLLTAITALSDLGEDFRFRTSLYARGEVRQGVLWGDLYAVGGFDPLFGYDDLQGLVCAVRDAGIDSVSGRIYVDISMKDTLKWGSGWCWDDEAERLTPLLYRGRDEFIPHLKTAFGDAGIGIEETALESDSLYTVCPPDARLLGRRTHALTEVLLPMMKESDNQYAEALFYQLAALSGRPYASAEDARARMDSLIIGFGFEPQHYDLVDGSGLSLYNYVSAELEIAFLRYAYQRDGIFPALYASLPVAGVDGTLKNRMRRSPARGKVRAKTGTLTGVATLAGYVQAPNGHWLAFCIMNQGQCKARSARDFQDRVCTLFLEH